MARQKLSQKVKSPNVMYVNCDITMDHNASLNYFHQSVSESDWLTVHT